ncbi:helix-turn-helix transcriptional regulator [Methanolobus chelungpuianus]|uniref:Transcriptional regulator n=1 Tax=Methanolobus chelungpuianus TaxID=502115 RepID=A0AAE3KXL6_9EURY|nr:winged helix-turn-helix domain-containing protein [Methanolobus chelungpuianus]MCQ6963036.1 transcriptional regulator [Methanolobus chelungpuianus]
MKKPLLDVIYASEKRKGSLLLLKDGPKEMEFLLRSLSTTRQALLPQLKVLEGHHLISHSRDTYCLTTIGKLIVVKMSSLLNTVNTFDTDIDYWGTHNLSFIPSPLLEKINELKKCALITPSITEFFDAVENIHPITITSPGIFDTFNKATMESKFYGTFTTFLNPTVQSVISQMLDNGVNVNFIITKSLFDIIQTKEYEFFAEFLRSHLFHFYIYPEGIDVLSFAYNNHYFILRLLKQTGEYESKYIFCSDPRSIEWAKELFNYYLERSKPVTEGWF